MAPIHQLSVLKDPMFKALPGFCVSVPLLEYVFL